MTTNPAVAPEFSVPVRCTRCHELVPTTWLAIRHQDEHIAHDRAMLRPSRRVEPTKDERPMRLAVGL